MKFNKLAKLTIVSLMVASTSGCSKFIDQAEAQGGYIGSSDAPYVITNSSGGVIQDVYLLEAGVVQSPSGSDGWLFVDGNDNPIYLGGDVKTIRINGNNKDEVFSQYTEYHILVDGLDFPTYFDKLKYDKRSQGIQPKTNVYRNPSNSKPLKFK
jgi:hypothetical protein